MSWAAARLYLNGHPRFRQPRSKKILASAAGVKKTKAALTTAVNVKREPEAMPKGPATQEPRLRSSAQKKVKKEPKQTPAQRKAHVRRKAKRGTVALRCVRSCPC